MAVTITLAKDSGFCFGVERAIEMAEKDLAEGGTIYSFGPLIHNPQEIEALSRKGIKVVESADEAPEGSHFIIRSHGASPEVLEAAKKRRLKIIDATCPLVKRAQNTAQFLSEHRFAVVIVGEQTHPEVVGILSYAPGAVVIETREDAGKYESSRRVGVIAQTTQSPESFREILEILLKKKFFEMRISNTICDATIKRQQAALEVARHADVMFVLGGHNSANTGRLSQICRQVGVETHQLETYEELDENTLMKKHAIGVTAGASTPDWVIEEFLDRVKHIVQDRFKEEVVIETPQARVSDEGVAQEPQSEGRKERF